MIMADYVKDYNGNDFLDVTPSIDITIPYYNKDAYLERCLYSLTRQTDKRFNVIIVDDGSDKQGHERLVEICKAYSGALKIWVKTTPNQGLFQARYEAALGSSADWIFPVDPDDELPSHCIESLRKTIRSCESNLDVVYFEIAAVYDDFRELYTRDGYWSDDKTLREVYKEVEEFRSPFMLCTKRSFLMNLYEHLKMIESPEDGNVEGLNRMPKLVYMEDVLLTSTALALGNPNIVFIDECLYNYRCDTGESCINRFDTDAEYKKSCLESIVNAMKWVKENCDFDFDSGFKCMTFIRNQFIKNLKEVGIDYEC